ncbi:amino acid ABC transporter permease [Clostridium sp. CS001]|uniref:amino acid ABC transporter permease n=1 Tax=Clostridium sp. CS001 TaxID=2880648 RepID=UPI001CF543F3|nr:amino acid ABC transporter permease [Clostridium sp. CS001]MCB2289689.1 amino acid ABC transporter permease [Clostridium sp. CS001]
MDIKFDIIINSLPYLLNATLVTIKFTIVSFIFALIIAFTVGILRSLKIQKIIDIILRGYMEIFRGTPLIIQLFFIYYGLPTVGIVLNCNTAAVIGLALNSGAYMSEIIRAAILSIDKGQSEAGFSLGFNKFQTILYIIMPQAIRNSIPPLMNAFSGLLKDSSLISVISITELTRSGNLIYSRTSRPFEIYITLGLFYFGMTYAVSLISYQIERRNNRWNS